VELKLPSPEQAYWGLRAMKTVAMANGVLDASERHMLGSIQRVFGTTHDLEQLALITPAELARSFPDLQLRRQLVQGLVIMTLIDGKAGPKETDHVEQFAQALEVDVPEVKNLRHILKGEILQLRLDLVRRFWLRPKINDVWNKEGIRGLYKFVRGMMGQYENKEVAARYHALEHCPPGSLGRSFGNIGMRMGSRFPDKRAEHPSKSCSMIVHTFCQAMERLRKRKSRSPASAPASSAASRGYSSFCLAAISRRHPYDTHHQGTDRNVRSAESHDRHSPRVLR
jgi:tellurite resistance protein